MSDIVTSRIFVDGEKGITAPKLNDITASSVIQPSFYTSKPTASTADPSDIALILKSGAYTQVPISTLTGSLSNAAIWSVRLRSFNAIGNPNFEVDQRTAGNGTGTIGNIFATDRWLKGGQLAANYTATQIPYAPAAPGINVPGTSFAITRSFLRVTLVVQKASLTASDFIMVATSIEGPALRELINDVHSVSILCRSTVAPLTFSVTLRDSTTGYSLVKLLTLPTAGIWTLLTLPNLPIWSSSGTFPVTPGSLGYSLGICLAASSSNQGVTDVWTPGNVLGGAGMSNFAASPVNSTFDIAFVQHEPGAVCSTLMDKPFEDNLRACKRYYAKSYGYGVLATTHTQSNQCMGSPSATTAPWIFTNTRFPVSLAKAPTFTIYSPANGATNSFSQPGVGDAGGSAAVVDTEGLSQINAFANMGSLLPVTFHYTADTGW